MQGVEGQIFGPMARTYAYALIGAIIATFTITPVLCSVLLPREGRGGRNLPRARHPQGLRERFCRVRSGNARSAALLAVLFLVLCGVLAPARHRIPAQARRRQHVDPGGDAADHHARSRHGDGRAHPQGDRQYQPVRTVASEQGRGDEGTDPDGSFLAEFFVPLKPQDEWTKGLTKDELIRQMSERLKREFIGIDFNFSQYIQDNIEEAVSGVKGENSVKIFGRDLVELERLSKRSRWSWPRSPASPTRPHSTCSGSPTSWCGSIARKQRATAFRLATSTRWCRLRSADKRSRAFTRAR